MVRGTTKTRVETALHEWGELFFTGVQYLDSLRQGVDVGCGSPKKHFQLFSATGGYEIGSTVLTSSGNDDRRLRRAISL
jgi:hypothetical protein